MVFSRGDLARRGTARRLRHYRAQFAEMKAVIYFN
ncbi:hypothetical protein PUN4_280112 [Paraburkholderia unamae]|nr:hypothetical protein PUN4_280112 [Paraburkholderia unamae]